MNSTRTRTDAQKYMEQEQNAAQATRAAKEKLAKAADDRRLARYWGQPLAELRQNLTQPALDKHAGMSLVADRQAATDGEACNSALLAFVEQLKSEGVALTEGGIIRLTCFGVAHSSVFTDMENIDNWRRAYNRLTELEAFASGEVESKELPATTQKPATTDIERIDTSTREGERAAKKLVFQQWMAEAKPLFKQFVAHMQSPVWNHPMTQDDQDRVCQFLYDKNLGISAKSLNVARQVVLNCRTEDELLGQEIESSTRSAEDREVRVAIKSRIRALKN